MIQINGRKHDLGGGFFVKRILPDKNKRMVGPFTFLDHMGPMTTLPGQNTDVRPHPHIGLSTLTYLFQGRMVHRDSLGIVADINAGEVNWMTSGKGITHSERAHADDRGLARTLHGLQFWVALPDESEDCDPSFQHYEATSIPSEENEQRIIKVIAGEAWGLHSPVKVTSPLVFAEVICKQDFTLSLKKNSFELAAYIISGQAKIKSTPLNEGDMMVSEISEELVIEIKSGTHLIIIGGEPFTKPRFMWWNLVSSSKEKIETAKKNWSEGKFPMVPGETEFIPLPSN